MYYEQVSENRFSPEIPLCSGRLDRSQSYDAPPPHLGPSIKKVRDFVANFAKLAKALQKSKKKPPFRLSWRRQTLSYSIKKSQNGSWQARAWTRTT
jgi:hypothetical protein